MACCISYGSKGNYEQEYRRITGGDRYWQRSRTLAHPHLIGLEIFAKIFSAIAEQMAVTVAKTSHTTFVRETQDFATALWTTPALQEGSAKE